MAIYHFSVQAISRGKGQSAVASASYRSGEKLQDERTGESKFYKREVMPDSVILAPEHAPEWAQDREKLWNEVERMESHKNSRLAREVNVALPVELSHGQQKELIQDYAKEQFVDKGMVADIAIHRDDTKNPHAHIMLTIRPFEKDGEWQKQKSKKEYLKDKEGNFLYNKKGNKKTRKIDLVGWDKEELIKDWRKEWSNHANKMLEREGVNERIDHRSHADRGLEFRPSQHVGYKASAMEKDGIQTDRGNYNREVEAYNQTVVDLQAYREAKQQMEQEKARQDEQKAQTERFSTPAERTQLASAEKFLKADPTFEAINKRLGQLARFEDKIYRNYQALEQKDQDFKNIKNHLFELSSSHNRIKENQTKLDSIGTLEGFTKRGKAIKQSAESEIQKHQSIVQEHERKLEPYREKYGFRSEPEFKAIEKKYQRERPDLREQDRNQRGAVRRERDVLQKAKSVLENRFIREVASKYPDNPEMAHMDYKTAQRVNFVNKEFGKTFSVKELKQLNELSNSADSVISSLQAQQSRLNQMDKGNSKSDIPLDQEKEKIDFALDKYTQVQDLSERSSGGLFDGIVKGIEQAQQQMEQQHKQHAKGKARQKQKYKQKGFELGG